MRDERERGERGEKEGMKDNEREKRERGGGWVRERRER